MNFFKAILASTLVALALCGCKYEKVQVITTDGANNAQRVGSGFNDETYIWENWIFPENRSEGK